MTNKALVNLVFMLEEESAKNLLEVLLPDVLPSCVTFRCISHQGKNDLKKSIPIKIKAWRDPNTFFVILHDQDSAECEKLKEKLQQLCKSSIHAPLIRIVCRELEAWYFGDLDAVQEVYPKFSAVKYKNKPKFRDPDEIVNPSEKLKELIRNFDKGYASREVPKYMDINNNKSGSFNQTINGIKSLVDTQLIAPKN